MERWLILGGSGFLGAHLVREAARHRVEVHSASRSALAGQPHVSWDALESGATHRLMTALRPRVVINAAALSRAGDCEREPERARALNTELPTGVARLARQLGARCVHVSTDLVFGGLPPAGERYTEEDEPVPVQRYGSSKLEGERGVQAANPDALVVRIPLLYGDSGGRGLGASDQLIAAVRNGEAPVLFDDEFRTPLDVAVAARALRELATSDLAGLLHLAGGDRVSRHELGLLTTPPELHPALRRGQRAQLGLSATRPADVSLDASRARARLSTPLAGVRGSASA